jgi:O-antigen/teichoic acid export membrane protein
VPMHSLAEVLAAYAGSFVLSAIAGATFVMQLPLPSQPSDERISIAALFRTGFHVLGANVAAGLAQSADRILVSVIVPITSMALYGFASSVAVAGTAATQTMQRVALSHAARRDGDDRAHFLGRFYDLTLAAFGVALLGLPFFEHTVSATLPAYATALPIVRAFVAGAPFWIALHVVLVGTLQSHLLVRRQFALELGGAALVVMACSACLAMHAPLWTVATAGSGAAFVTWCAGVIVVNHDVPAARAQGAGRFALICGAQMAALCAAVAITPDWKLQTAVYALLAAIPTYAAIRAARMPWG